MKEIDLSVKISGCVFFPYAQHIWEVPSSMRLFRITTKFQDGKTSAKLTVASRGPLYPKEATQVKTALADF